MVLMVDSHVQRSAARLLPARAIGADTASVNNADDRRKRGVDARALLGGWEKWRNEGGKVETGSGGRSSNPKIQIPSSKEG